MKKRYLMLALALVLLAGCKKTWVAKVGSVEVTEKDLQDRMKVSEIYYPNSGKRYIALSQLVQGYLDEEVLKQLGYKVDESTWEAESKRIDENTKAPDVLKKLKAVYSLDHAGYIKTFIRPVYGERYLYNEVFLKVPEIHKEQRAKAEKFIQQAAAKPEAFKELAQKMGLKAGELKVSEKEGIQPMEESERKKALEPEGRPPEPAGLEQAKFMIDKVKGLEDGKVLSEIIEWQEGYQILRLVRKETGVPAQEGKAHLLEPPKMHPSPEGAVNAGEEGEVYIIQSVSIPKRDYDEWFWSYAAKIPINIVDKALKAELLKEVGWTSKLKLE